MRHLPPKNDRPPSSARVSYKNKQGFIISLHELQSYFEATVIGVFVVAIKAPVISFRWFVFHSNKAKKKKNVNEQPGAGAI